MRLAAKLTGRQFAALAGWADATNVTKIEKAQRTITPDQIRLWCRLCGASGRRTEELLAEQEAAARMWVTYQQLNRSGLTGAQKSVRTQYEQLKLSRSYQPKVIPGMLQTEAYTRAALTGVIIEQGVDVPDHDDDLAEAVAERMDRQTLLRGPDTRWLFVLEEPVLWFHPYSQELHAVQLRHLLTVMRKPNVVLRIIPADADRRGIHPAEAFNMIDSRLVTVELISGYLSVTTPIEVAMYTFEWDRFWSLSVGGTKAAALVERALRRFDSQDGL